MFKALILLLSSLSAFAQVGFGSFNIVPNLGGNNLPIPLSFAGLQLWADIYQSGITNTNGTAVLNAQTIQGIQDLSGNGFPLMNLSGDTNTQFIYFNSGGQTNGPRIQMGFFHNGGWPKEYLTNYCNFTSKSQTNTYFLVINDHGNGSSVPSFFDSLSGSSHNSLSEDPGPSLDMAAGSTVHIFSGVATDTAANIGFLYDTGMVLTVQFNASNSQFWINGVGPKSTALSGPNYAPGSQAMQGIIIGCNQAINAAACSANLYAFLWYNGGSMTSNNIVSVARYLCSEFGLTAPP